MATGAAPARAARAKTCPAFSGAPNRSVLSTVIKARWRRTVTAAAQGRYNTRSGATNKASRNRHNLLLNQGSEKRLGIGPRFFCQWVSTYRSTARLGYFTVKMTRNNDLSPYRNCL